MYAIRSYYDKIDTESFKQLERLRELRVSHRDLDYLIDRLQEDPMVDQLRRITSYNVCYTKLLRTSSA